MPAIYLDWNSTTVLRPEVWEAMRPVMTEAFGNPSSAHAVGRQARRYLESARETVGRCLHADADEVLFTSGATEANNLAIFGLSANWPANSQVLSSKIEHPCVVEPLTQLAKRGHTVTWLPASATGHIEMDRLREAIRPETRLITLMLANHETGAIQPVRHAAKTWHKSLAIHTDAAQAVGKIPVDFHDLSVTTLSLSAHKFGGPKGIGALLVRKGTTLHPQLFGGHQQKAQRPGTEPVALAVGMARALELACAEQAENLAKLTANRDLFFSAVAEVYPEVVVNGPPIPTPTDSTALPTTLNLGFPGVRSDLLLMSLDLAGISCSTGSACSSGSLLPSPVLQAMETPDAVLRSSLRFSFHASQTADQLREAGRIIGQTARSLR
ncbi:MAG: cysteine desulfurase family protein [Fimbriiglobus sp.]